MQAQADSLVSCPHPDLSLQAPAELCGRAVCVATSPPAAARRVREGTLRKDSTMAKKKAAARSKPRKRKRDAVKKFGKKADMTEFRAQLDTLGLKIIEVTADGNCFYRAMGDQLEGSEEEHMKYRTMVVEYIAKHREEFEPFMGEVPFDEYCSNMLKDGTWAGHMELQAASRVTRRNICIHMLNSPCWYIHNFSAHEATTTINLSYHNGEHYNSVRLREDPCQGPAMPVIIKTDANVSSTNNSAQTKAKDLNKSSHKSTYDNRSVKLVMAGTGYSDVAAVEHVSAEIDGDVDAAIEYMIAERLAVRTGDAEGNCCVDNASNGAELRQDENEVVEQKGEASCSSKDETVEIPQKLHSKKEKSRTKDCSCGSTKKHQTSCSLATAAGEGSSATPPPPVRFPLYPKSGTARDVVKWSVACRKLHKERAKDPRLKLSTVREPQDPETTEAVQNPKDKKTVIHAARSIVSISSVGHDGMKIRQCSGIIFCTHEGKVIVATSSLVVCKMGRLLDPLPRVSIRLSDVDRTTLDGELVFFDYHYDLALLAIEVPFPVKVADSGSCPRYGQEIYALARAEESNLMVRHGIVKYHGESGYLGRDYYFFLDCEIPEEGTGGSVVDLEGKTIGMTLRMSPHPAVVSITTMEICIAMALQFGRIARPLHGLSLRSISFLDVELLDELSSCYDIDTGFIVDRVSHGSVAERLGIEYGDVICSFGLQTSTLPELEDHLLDLGLKYLQHPESTSELKVRVCSLLKRSGRTISLPITFCTKKVSYVRMRQ